MLESEFAIVCAQVYHFTISIVRTCNVFPKIFRRLFEEVGENHGHAVSPKNPR